MHCAVCPSFSGTPGAGEKIEKRFVFDFSVEKCLYLTDASIVNVWMYRERASKQSQVQVLPKLLQLKKSLEEIYSNSIDPIEYLISLYYKDGLSTEEIAERTSKLSFWYITKNGIQKLFKDTLRWELRDPHEITEKRKRRLASSNNPSNIWLRASREKLWVENAQKFHSAIIAILESSHREKRKFSEDEFHALTTKSEKIFYLMKVFEWITFTSLCAIAVNTWMWWASLARIINEKLLIIHTNHSHIPRLTISPAMIHLLLQQAWVKN